MLTSFNLTNDKLKRRFDNHKALKLFIREPGTLIYVPGSYYLGSWLLKLKWLNQPFITLIIDFKVEHQMSSLFE